MHESLLETLSNVSNFPTDKNYFKLLFNTGAKGLQYNMRQFICEISVKQQDQVNNANSAFIFIYRLISRGLRSGPGGPGV